MQVGSLTEYLICYNNVGISVQKCVGEKVLMKWIQLMYVRHKELWDANTCIGMTLESGVTAPAGMMTVAERVPHWEPMKLFLSIPRGLPE